MLDVGNIEYRFFWGEWHSKKGGSHSVIALLC